MRRILIIILGVFIVGTSILSSCASKSTCAAYNTYPKKKGRTK